MKPQPGSTVDTVRDFWQAHINNEYYTEAERASDSYFDEIEERRYRTHYHLPELFASLDGHGQRLLEVGCGIGVDSIQLAKRGFQVTAVDLTENALTVARQFAARRGVSIDFRLGNAEGLDFPDESFDAVYSFGVLHHTPDIERSVAEVRRVLRPAGTAQVMLYHRDSLVNLVQPRRRPQAVPRLLPRGGARGLPLHLRLRPARHKAPPGRPPPARPPHRLAPDDHRRPLKSRAARPPHHGAPPRPVFRSASPTEILDSGRRGYSVKCP